MILHNKSKLHLYVELTRKSWSLEYIFSFSGSDEWKNELPRCEIYTAIE